MRHRIAKAQTVSVRIFDNGEELPSQEVELQAGSQTFAFPHTFQEEGLHELRFEVVSSDRIQENNTYYSYYNLEMFNDILIVERAEGESDKLVEILSVHFPTVILLQFMMRKPSESILSNKISGVVFANPKRGNNKINKKKSFFIDNIVVLQIMSKIHNIEDKVKYKPYFFRIISIQL